MRYRVRDKVFSISCATVLAVAATAPSAAMGNAAPLPSSNAAGLPPGWLGDIPGIAPVPPDVKAPNAPVNLAGCTVTLDAFKDDPTRVRPFVPAHYQLGTLPYFGPGFATVGAMALVCDAARVDGGPPARTVISLMAVHILADGPENGATDALWDAYNRAGLNLNLASSTWYLIAAGTDNATLARRFQAIGLPLEYLPNLDYHNDYSTASKSDRLTVPSPASGYQLDTTTMVPDCCFYHNHDMAVVYDGPKGPVGFVNHLYAMIDSACGYWASTLVYKFVPSCRARLTAQPGSRTANFLGGSSRETTWAFNHPKAHQPGYLTLLEPSARN
jgi:hypothetical protein